MTGHLTIQHYTSKNSYGELYLSCLKTHQDKQEGEQTIKHVFFFTFKLADVDWIDNADITIQIHSFLSILNLF